MLPDFPESKKLVAKKFDDRVERTRRMFLGIFDEAAKTVIQEGRPVIQRADGERSELEMPTLESKAFLKGQHISDVSPDDMLKVLDEIGEGLAAQQVDMMLKTMHEQVKNVVEGANQDPVDLIFEMFKKVQIDFNEKGEMIMPSLITGGMEMRLRFDRAMRKIESTKVLRAKFEVLIEQKRQEWHDREASRKLVE